MHAGDEVAPSPQRHRLRILGKNFSLFSMYFGANSVPSVSLPTSLARSMILRWPVVSSKKPASPVLTIAVRRHRFGGLGVVLEIGREHAGRAEQHLAGLGDADVDVGGGRADGVGADLAVRLRRDIEERFGLAVELLQVEAERAVEGEQVGADRLARRIGDADAREAEHVLERPVDQQTRRAHRAAGRSAAPARRSGCARRIVARDGDEVMEHAPLQEAGILHADHDARQQGLRARAAARNRRSGRSRAGPPSPSRCFPGRRCRSRHQALRVVEIMIADPGERQIGEHHVVLGQLVERHRVGGGLDPAAAPMSTTPFDAPVVPDV